MQSEIMQIKPIILDIVLESWVEIWNIYFLILYFWIFHYNQVIHFYFKIVKYTFTSYCYWKMAYYIIVHTEMEKYDPIWYVQVNSII